MKDRQNIAQDIAQAVIEHIAAASAGSDRATFHLTHEQAVTMAELFRIVRDKQELKHTCYIELCPGRQRTKACWNEGALYIDIDAFTYIEAAFETSVEKFSEYSFTIFSREEWLLIIAKLMKQQDALLTATVPHDVWPHWSETNWHHSAMFMKDFHYMKNLLVDVTHDLAVTLRGWCDTQDDIYFLGL